MFYIDSVYSTVLKIYVPNADYIKTYKKNSIQRTEEQKLHGREEKKKKKPVTTQFHISHISNGTKNMCIEQLSIEMMKYFHS